MNKQIVIKIFVVYTIISLIDSFIYKQPTFGLCFGVGGLLGSLYGFIRNYKK